MAFSNVDSSSSLRKLHNQRSFIVFTSKGLYGPKCIITAKSDNPDVVVEDDPSCEHHMTWCDSPETILIIKKIGDKEVTEKFVELCTYLIKESGRDLTVIVESGVVEEVRAKEYDESREVLERLKSWTEDDQKYVLSTVDLIICIGGDGTLLYTSTLFPEAIPPIMAFHMGSLGFLTPFQFESLKSSIEKVLNGNVSITLRHRLDCRLKTESLVSTSHQSDACPLDLGKKLVKFTPRLTLHTDHTATKKRMNVVNELVVDRGPSPFLTYLEVFCNERLMTTVQGDGLIVATPTGSTAYSLAAGASMVHPSVPCMIITPICPHSLSFRPIVVPAGVEILVKVAHDSRSTAWVGFDGRNRQEIKHGESVVVTASPWAIPTINNTGHVTDWFDSLAECLHWNARKQQKPK